MSFAAYVNSSWCILQISSPSFPHQVGGLVPRILSFRRLMFGWMEIWGQDHTISKITPLSTTMIASICMGTSGLTAFALIKPLLYVEKTQVKNILQFIAKNGLVIKYFKKWSFPFTEMFRCVEFQPSPDVETVVYTHEQMNRQMCIQVCDGNLSVNALLKKKNCICTNTSMDSLVNYLPESVCNTKCPGNTHQICGGSNAYSYKRSMLASNCKIEIKIQNFIYLNWYYILSSGVNLTRASSCKDLENQGLGDITVMLSGTSQPTYCPQTGKI